MRIEAQEWRRELAQHDEWFRKLGDRLPPQFALKRELLALRLTRSEAAH
jgi:phosphoenolpyruvate carboxykinase (GTP)